MNNQQEHLLTLLKEINELCIRYNIPYYCTGGTLIGAARHSGFIPWDDDIDVYFFRDDFNKFLDAFSKDGKNNRALTSNQQDSDYYSVIPRYIDRDTTVFCKYHMLGHAPAGVNIDVFILDPIPDGYEAHKDYIDKFYVYCDLVMPFYSFSHRASDKNYGLYEDYTKDLNKDNRQILKTLEKELFCYNMDQCEDVVLRWGSIPSIFPKKMFGTPTYLPFEDMMIPVPEYWYEYLIQLYGTNWMVLPNAESQLTHDTICRYDVSYNKYYDIRDGIIDSEELNRDYFIRKDAYRKYEEKNRVISKNRIAFKELTILKALYSDLEDLHNESNSQKILDAFTAYLELQFSIDCMGALNHTYLYRWYNPYIVNIKDQQLNMLFDALFKNNKEEVAEKIVNIYKRANVYSNPIKHADECIKLINNIKKMYYTNNFSKCIYIYENCSTEYNTPVFSYYYYLALANTNPGIVINAFSDIWDESCDELKKAYADSLYNTGKIEEAKGYYKKLMTSCRNGLFWFDINKKMTIDPIPLHAVQKYSPTDANKVKIQLLDEIIDFCDKNNIPYVLDPQLSRRMFLLGNMGYDNERMKIYMDASSAKKFLKAIKKNVPEGIDIFTWKNDNQMTDFVIKYSLKNSTYVDFENYDSTKKYGIHVDIVILQSNIKNTLKKAIVRSATIAAGGKNGFMRKPLMDLILNAEIKALHSTYYYFTYDSEGNRKRNKFYDGDWKDTTTITLNNKEYKIPKSTTKAHFRVEIKMSNKRNNMGGRYFYFPFRCGDEEYNAFKSDMFFNKDYQNLSNNLKKAMHTTDMYWERMKCVEDSELLNTKYSSEIETIKKHIENKEFDIVGKILGELDDLVKHYLKFDLVLNFDNDLYKCYFNYLDAINQERFVERIEKLINNQ